MGEETFRQTRKGCHQTRVEGLYSFVHRQGPLVIEQQQPKAPSPVAYDESAIYTCNVILRHT